MKKFHIKTAVAILAALCVLAAVLAVCAACAPQLEEKRTVTFWNGNEVFEVQEWTLGEKYTLPSGTPVREQPDDEHVYEFLGWTLDPDFYEYRSELITEPDFVLADIDIYAAFRLQAISDRPDGGADLVYNVEFRMPTGEDFGQWSGVTLEEYTQTVKRYGNAELPSEEDMPQIEGYYFTGNWSGGSLSDVRGHRRVTAVYERRSYTLTLHYLGKTDARQVFFHDNVDLSEQPYVDEAFVFDGWYTDAQLQTQATLTRVPAEDVELFAAYHVDFTTATVSHEGTMVYGDATNNLYVSGLKECDGLAYTFVWTVNGQAQDKSNVRYRRVRDAGQYGISVQIFADYNNGVLTDSAFALTEQGEQQFVYTVEKATLSATVTLSANSVEYGSPVPQATVEYSGFVFDETAQSVQVGQSFVYMLGERDVTGTNLHVGSYRVETVPATLANYKFAPIQAPTFDVTPKDLVLSASVESGTYGDPFTYSVTFDGFVESYGDNEQVLGEHWFTLDGAGRYVGGELVHAGSHSAQLNGYSSADYNVQLPDACSFSVAKREASASLVAKGGIYGVTPEITPIFHNVLEGDEQRFEPAYTYKRQGNAYSSVSRFVVGAYSVDAAFTENGFEDYNTLAVTGAEFSIQQKPLTVGVSLGDSFVYGQSIRPVAVFEDAFEFGESAQTEGLVKGTLRYVYRTSAGEAYEYANFGVNSYTVTVDGIYSDNYSFTFAAKSFNVTKKLLKLAVHLQQDAILYGTAPQVSLGDELFNGISYDGFELGDTARSVFGNSLPTVYYLDDGGRRTTEFHAGTYTATTSAEAHNYSIEVTSAPLTVNRRTLFVGIALSHSSLVYGSKPVATPVYEQDGYDGFVGGEQRLYASLSEVKYSGTQVYLQSELNGESTKMVAGTYTLSVVGISEDVAKDYIVTYAYEQAAVSFEIAPMEVAVTLTSAQRYTYGDTPRVSVLFGRLAYNETAQELFGSRATEVVFMQEGSEVTVDKYIRTGTYTATLKGIQNPNYTFTLEECGFTVQPKALSVSVAVEDFTYGDRALPTYTLAYNGFVEGEDFAVLGGSAEVSYLRGNGKYTSEFFDAGTYTATVSGLASDNYSISYSGDEFTVAKRSFTVSPAATGCTYGQQPQYSFTSTVLSRDLADFAFAYSFTFSRSGSGFAPYNEQDYARFQAGNYRMTVTYTPNDNYNDAAVPTVSFVVARKQLILSASADSFVYGGTPNPTFTRQGLEEGDEALLEQIAYTYSGAGLRGDVFHTGTYTVSIQAIQSDNYALTYESGSFAVTPAPLTVTVSAQDHTYGDKAMPVTSLSYDGFQHNDGAANLSGHAEYTYTRSDDASGSKQPYTSDYFGAGYYALTVQGLTSEDYAITFVGGSFVIAKAALTVGVEVDNFQYDGATQPNARLTYNGFVRGEGSTVLGGQVHLDYTGNVRGDVFHAGAYTVDASGLTSPNYSISYTQGSFSVAQRSVSLSFGEVWSTYADDPQDYMWYTVGGDGILGSELTFAASLTRNGSAYTQGSEEYFSVGKYVVTVSYEENPDYAVSCNGKPLQGSVSRDPFTIAQRPVTLTLQSSPKWANRADWFATPAISDERFTVNGQIALNNAQSAAAGLLYSSDADALGSHFLWKNGFSVTLHGVDVTSNLSFNYAIKITLDNSSFQVELPQNPGFTFDGNPHSFSVSATADGIAEESIKYAYSLAQEGEYSDKPIEFVDWQHGGYTVWYKVSAPNATESNGSFHVDVAKANLTVVAPQPVTATYQPSVNRFVALQGGTNVVGAAADKNFRFTVGYSLNSTEYNSAALTLTDVANSGTVYFRVDAGQNYNLATGRYSVSIAKATVSVPTVPRTVYTGAVQKADIADENIGKLYTVTKNDGGVNANAEGYEVELTLVDPANYVWTTAQNSAAVTLRLVITKANLTVNAPADFDSAFDGKDHFARVTDVTGAAEELHPQFTVRYSLDSANFDQTTLTLRDVQSHTVHFRVDAGSNYNPATGSYSVAISPANINVTAPKGYAGTYDGANHFAQVQQIAGVEGDEVQFDVKYSKDDSYANAALTLVDVADSCTVHFRVTAIGTNNYLPFVGTYTVAISPATPQMSLPQSTEALAQELQQAGIQVQHDGQAAKLVSTYNTQNRSELFAQAVQFGNRHNDAAVQYALEVVQPAGIALAEDLVWTDNAATLEITSAGSYRLHVRFNNANYTAEETVFDITVNKAQATLNVENVQRQYTYNAALQRVDSGATTNNGDVGAAITYSNNTFTDVPKGGTQIVTVSIADTANYIGTSVTVEISIAKYQAVLDVSKVITSYTYNGTTQTVDSGAVAKGIGSDVNGLGAISYSSNSFRDVRADGYTVTVTLADGTNYLGTTQDVTVHVSPADYVISAPGQTYDYNGQPQGQAITVTGVGEDAESLACTVLYNGSAQVAQFKDWARSGHNVEFTVSGNPNYKDYTTGSYTITINKATLSAKVDPITAEYNNADHFVEITKENITGLYGEDTFSVRYGKDINYSGAPEIKNAQSSAYTVYFQIDAGANYEVFASTYSITVTRKDITVTLTEGKGGTYSGSEYGGEAKVEFTGVCDGDSSISVNFEEQTTAYNGSSCPTFINSGKYVVKVTAESGNYTFDGKDKFEGSYSVEVLQKQLTVTVQDVTKKYNGSNQFVSIGEEMVQGLVAGDRLRVVYCKTEEGAAYGDAWSIVDVSDTCTVWYQISAGKDGIFTNYVMVAGHYQVTINAAKLNKPTAGTTDFVYDKSQHTFVLNGFDAATMNIDKPELSGINAGEYKYVVSLKDAANYEWQEGGTEQLSYKFTIAKATLEKLPDGIELPAVDEQINRIGKKLESIDLADGFRWANSEESLTLGSHTYNAFFNPDTRNYNDFAVTITFNTRKENVRVQQKADSVPVIGFDFGTTPNNNAAVGSFEIIGEDGTVTNSLLEYVVLALTGKGNYNEEIGSTYLGTVVFTCAENDYFTFDSTEFDDIVIKIRSVDVAGTLYTIEDALATAGKGAVIVRYNTALASAEIASKALYNVELGHYTVKIGVTLILPYNGNEYVENVTEKSNKETYETGINTTAGATGGSTFGNEKYKKIELTLGEGLTLYNNGTIRVGGVTSAQQNYAGGTAGDFAQITLMNQAVIESNGNMDVYGFIAEASPNNGSKLNMNAGTLRMTFRVYEHRGGSAYAAMVKGGLKGSPFNRYYMENCTALLTIKSTAHLVGYANMYASSQDNTTDIKLAGNGSDEMIQLESESYLTMKLDHSNFVAEIKIYGSMKLNPLKLTVAGATVSMDQTFFPFSYLQQIYLYSLDGQESTVNCSAQNIKLFPGSKVVIGENVTVNAKQIVIYNNSYKDELTYSRKDNTLFLVYPDGTGDAQLIVAGTLKAENVGGKVAASGDGAKFSYTGSGNVDSYELDDVSGSGFFASCTWHAYTNVLTGDVYNFDGNTKSVVLTTAKSFVSRNGAWITDDSKFEMQYRFFARDDESSAISPFADEGISVNNPNCYTVAGLDLANASMPGSKFVGWFEDEQCTLSITNIDKWKQSRETITVYGLFEKLPEGTKSYTLNLDANGEGATVNGNATANEVLLEEDFASYKLPEPQREGYDFGGWFTQKDGGGIQVETLSADEFVNEELTLYAKWTVKEYKLKLDINKNTSLKVSVTVEGDTTEYSSSTTVSVPYGATVKIVSGSANSGYNSFAVSSVPDGLVTKVGSEFQMTQDVTIKTTCQKNSGSCVAGGTLITLADGTQKKIEDLVMGEDELLIFDHFTGQLSKTKKFLLIYRPMQSVETVKLHFSNGTTVHVVAAHGFFDVDTNQYEIISTQNVASYVGHKFYTINYNGEIVTNGIAELVSYELSTECIECYSLFTSIAANHFANGMLAITDDGEGLYNYFDLDENMKYEEEKMQQDIETYGVFKYEEFAEYLTKEEFDMFNVQYLKIALGKGLVDMERIYHYFDVVASFRGSY